MEGTEPWRWACLALFVSVPTTFDYLTAPRARPQLGITTGYVLMQQAGDQPEHFVPEPRSVRFPQDAIAFTNAQAAWNCSWTVAVRTMLEQRQGGHTRYWCKHTAVRILENVR